MTEPRVVVKAVPDVAPAGELSALAAIYRRAIERYEETCRTKKNAADVTSIDGDDTKERSVNDFRANAILHD